MLKIGNRGAGAYEPENTISFQRASDIDVDAVELDVRLTKDSEVVVIHDLEVDRITNGKGLVSELTLKEIKGPSTEKSEKILTSGEALDFLDSKVRILIELKEPGYEDRVLKAIRERRLEKKTILVSFSEDALRRVRELDKDIEIGLIYVHHKNTVRTALDLKAQYLLSLYRFTHTANVKKAHDDGLKVIV